MSAAAGQNKLSRDDWRKKKELEEARKAGTAPAEVDEEGRDINPHIPQYISQAPWYVSLGRPSLKHQRPQEEKQQQFNAITDWYKKGTEAAERSTARKYRKGACENCGAMTHQKKDCLERPRKVGAKFSNKDICPDERVQPDLSFSYDAKRDRWNGYNPDDHQHVIEEYEKVEVAKRQLKADKLQSELLSGQLSESSIKEATNDSDGSDADEEKYADQADMPGTKFDSKTRTTVRNLRIREDTAKYLYNLDPNSAYYDPKTRSMRENPFKNANNDSALLKFSGDNFIKRSGDVKQFAHTQMFAWQAYEHGTDIHPLADPTKLEVMHKEFKVKKEDFKGDQQLSVLERYGGEEHLDAPPKELLLAQTENYVEYSRLGNIIKGQERAVVKSRYEEDVHPNNHSSVWGSYWEAGRWGFACCHSFIKGAYCTGEAGKMAKRAAPVMAEVKVDSEPTPPPPQSMVEQHKARRGKRSKQELREEQQRKEEEEEALKEQRLKEALLAESAREEEVERMMAVGERKRPYHSMRAEESRVPTEEEMEAFRLKRRRVDDPMAHLL